MKMKIIIAIITRAKSAELMRYLQNLVEIFQLFFLLGVAFCGNENFMFIGAHFSFEDTGRLALL